MVYLHTRNLNDTDKFMLKIFTTYIDTACCQYDCFGSAPRKYIQCSAYRHKLRHADSMTYTYVIAQYSTTVIIDLDCWLVGWLADDFEFENSMEPMPRHFTSYSYCSSWTSRVSLACCFEMLIPFFFFLFLLF